MEQEIDLLKNYPKTKRDLSKRLSEKTENVIYFLGTFRRDFSSSVKLSKYLVLVKSLWDLPNCFVGATLIKK